MNAKMAPARVKARANAARDLHDTLTTLVCEGEPGATLRAVAERLGISHTHMQRLCGDGDPAIACGDVEAMGARIAVAYYARRLARCRDASDLRGPARDLRDLALDTISAVGAFAERLRVSLEDGVIDDMELARIESAAFTLQSKIAVVLSACAEMRAHRGTR